MSQVTTILLQEKQLITFKNGEVIKLPLKRKRNRVYLTSELAQSLTPKEVLSGTSLSTVTGILQVKDNLHDIQPCEEVENKSQIPTLEQALKKTKYEWGTLNIELFLKKLNQDGITDVKVDSNGDGSVIITLQGEDTTIRIDEKSTHIICGGKQSLRLKLRDFLLKCIETF